MSHSFWTFFIPSKHTGAPSVCQKIWGTITAVFPILFHRSSLLFNFNKWKFWKLSEDEIGIRGLKMTCFSFEKWQYKI